MPLTRALNLFFPPQCLLCHAIIPEEGALCVTCWDNVTFIEAPMCACCGLPFEYGMEPCMICAECMKEEPSFTKARACMYYDDASRFLVTALKYHDRTALAHTYGRWLARTGAEILADADIIIPVPLHYWRMFRRRYNQSALLADALAKNCTLPVYKDALCRVKFTRPQTGLNRRQRKANLRAAFCIKDKSKALLQNKIVVLIDDVYTTGTTLQACAKVLLKEGGAREVRALTLARRV